MDCKVKVALLLQIDAQRTIGWRWIHAATGTVHALAWSSKQIWRIHGQIFHMVTRCLNYISIYTKMLLCMYMHSQKLRHINSNYSQNQF